MKPKGLNKNRGKKKEKYDMPKHCAFYASIPTVLYSTEHWLESTEIPTFTG